MTFDYARAKATAERLIATFGQEAVLTQNTSSGDAWAPTLSPEETTIVVVDLNEAQRDRAGSLVGTTVRTLYVSTSAGVTPGKGDTVTISGSAFEITEVRPLAPGGTAVFFEADLVT